MLRPPPPALLAPTAQALTRRSLPGFLGIIVAPGAITLARGGSDLTGSATFAFLAGAACSAFCTEDTTPWLASAPVGRAARQVTIGVLVAIAVAVALGTGAALATALGADLGPTTGLVPEAAAAAGLSLALTTLPERTTSVPPPTAAFTALTAMALSSGLHAFHPAFSFLPVVGMPDHAHRWWLVAGLALLVFMSRHRDPAAHPPGRMRRVPRHPKRLGHVPEHVASTGGGGSQQVRRWTSG